MQSSSDYCDLVLNAQQIQPQIVGETTATTFTGLTNVDNRALRVWVVVKECTDVQTEYAWVFDTFRSRPPTPPLVLDSLSGRTVRLRYEAGDARSYSLRILRDSPLGGTGYLDLTPSTWCPAGSSKIFEDSLANEPDGLWRYRLAAQNAAGDAVSSAVTISVGDTGGTPRDQFIQRGSGEDQAWTIIDSRLVGRECDVCPDLPGSDPCRRGGRSKLRRPQRRPTHSPRSARPGRRRKPRWSSDLDTSDRRDEEAGTDRSGYGIRRRYHEVRLRERGRFGGAGDAEPGRLSILHDVDDPGDGGARRDMGGRDRRRSTSYRCLRRRDRRHRRWCPARNESSGEAAGCPDSRPSDRGGGTEQEGRRHWRDRPEPHRNSNFPQYGTGRIEGMVVSTEPWLPPDGIIEIDPGKTATIVFTINWAKRPCRCRAGLTRG